MLVSPRVPQEKEHYCCHHYYSSHSFLRRFPEERGLSEIAFALPIGKHKPWVSDPLETSSFPAYMSHRLPTFVQTVQDVNGQIPLLLTLHFLTLPGGRQSF